MYYPFSYQKADKNKNMIDGKPIGKIIHYFSKIGVAIIKLEDSLKVGDKIKMAVGDIEFEQEVDSMEVEHQKIEKAKKGDVIGIKVKEKVKEGILVFKA